jgi:hypothetical protein
VSDSLYALGSGQHNRWLSRRPRRRLQQRRATGALYLALGGWAALTGAPVSRGGMRYSSRRRRPSFAARASS